MEARPEYEGLEAGLTKSHEVKIEADEIVAEKAQKSWEESEKNDPELIEAGVERLGDLVGTGHFGGRAPVKTDANLSKTILPEYNGELHGTPHQ